MPESAARYLLHNYGTSGALPALYGQSAPIVNFMAQSVTTDAHQNSTVSDAGTAQQAQREGESAAALYRCLCNLGAQPEASVLQMAARAGHSEVVREVLSSGMEGLDLDSALLAALRHATDLERALELMQLLESAGAVASPAERQAELVGNLNGHMAGTLLRELGLLTDIDDILYAALAAGNRCLAHELLDQGAQPIAGALTAACKTGDEDLFGRILRMGAVSPRNIGALAAVVTMDSGCMLRQLLDAARWPPEDPTMRNALHYACSSGSAECAELLLQAGVDPGAARALHGAALSGHLGLLRRLLGTGRNGLTRRTLNAALEAACRCASVECARELLRAGASPGRSRALQVAAGVNALHVVQLLLDTRSAVTGGRAGRLPVNGALLQACRRGRLEAMEVLLRAGATAKDALQVAAQAGQLVAVRWLLATGKFPADDCHAHAALQSAYGQGNLEMVLELLGAGADRAFPLERAVLDGRTDFLRALLEWHPRMREPGLLRRTLGGASLRGCMASVHVLLDAGAEPDDGLYGAVHGGHDDIVRVLLGTGRCPPEGEGMQSALTSLCMHGSLEMVQTLLRAGARPLTCLTVAALNGRLAVLQELLAAAGPCRPDEPLAADALAAACKSDCAAVVQALLDAGVDPWFGLAEAASSGRVELVRMLLAARREETAWMRGMPDVALCLACYYQNLGVVRELLAAGANPALALSGSTICANKECWDALIASGRCPPELVAATTPVVPGDTAASKHATVHSPYHLWTVVPAGDEEEEHEIPYAKDYRVALQTVILRATSSFGGKALWYLA